MYGCLLVVLVAGCTQQTSKQEAEMNRFVDQLMAKMTLEEKLGQLNLPVSGDIVTGEPRQSNVSEDIRKGRVGGLFNVKGAMLFTAMRRSFLSPWRWLVLGIWRQWSVRRR